MADPTLATILKALQKTVVGKDEFTAAFASLSALVSRVQKELIQRIDAKLAAITNGKDGKDGKDGRDGTNGANGINGRDGKDGTDGANGRDGIDGKSGKDGKDGSPDNADDIRNKLEAGFIEAPENEKIDRRVIKDLDKDIRELKARPSGGGGMSQLALQMAMAKLIKHEVHSTTSATTSITLSDRVAHNVIIWAYYNGQLMSLGQQYTVSGKTITPSFTLADDSEWEFTYFRG